MKLTPPFTTDDSFVVGQDMQALHSLKETYGQVSLENDE